MTSKSNQILTYKVVKSCFTKIYKMCQILRFYDRKFRRNSCLTKFVKWQKWALLTAHSLTHLFSTMIYCLNKTARFLDLSQIYY